jgi:hypothetical protein
MKNFFSLVHMVTNATSEEKVAVGMLIVDANGPWFAFSKAKIAIAGKLVGDDGVSNSVEAMLRGIEKETKKNGKGGFVEREMFTSAYVNYLNTYDKGLVSFSEPTSLPSSWSSSLRESLVKLYIGETEREPKRIKSRLADIVKKKLENPIIKERADVNYMLSPRVLESIYSNHRISYISRNGHIVAGGVVDFNAEEITVEHKFAEYRSIYAGLALFTKKERLKEKPELIICVNEPESSAGRKLRDMVHKDSTKPFRMETIEILDKIPVELERLNSRRFSEFV